MAEVTFDELKKKYFKAFAFIIFLAAFTQIFIQSYIYFQKPNSKIINVSGRQRMLSQRITRYALLHRQPGIENSITQDTLAKLMVEFQSSHGYLKSIAQEHFWMGGTYHQIYQDLSALDSKMVDIKKDVECVMDSACDFGLPIKNAFVKKTDSFLLEMDQIVKRFELAASHQLYLLGFIELGLFLFTLAILFYEYLLVVVPLNRYVQSQVKSLEKKHNDFLEQQAMARHSSKLATVGELAAGVGHEINNPLTIMFAHLKKLKTLVKNDPQQTEAIVDKVENSANRIATIVRGLQKFSRSNDKPQEELELASLVMDTVESLQMFVGHSNYQIDYVDIETEVSKIIRGNQGEIRQTVINLVKNSVDCLKGSSDPHISVSCYNKDNWVCIDVTDNGPGIPEELREKLFQPFFTTKDPNKGTGLGLAIVRRLVKDGGGEIDFKTSSSGTTFTVKYPSLASSEEKIG